MEIGAVTAVAIALATAAGAYLGDKIGELGRVWNTLLRWAGVALVATIGIGVLRMYTDSGQAAVLVIALLVLGEWLAGRAESGVGRMSQLLTVAIIAGHHLPEGIAAGMSCIRGDALSWMVCGAVALHCIPETMVIMPTVRAAGISDRWGYIAAAISGWLEIIGVLLGCMI